MNGSLPAWVRAVALALALSAGAAKAEDAGVAGVRVIDFTPRFLDFYSRAIDLDDADERFALWKQHYDFVALPPGVPDRDERAQRMLAAAWPRYPAVMDRIEAGALGLSPAPGAVIEQVARLLELRGESPAVVLLYYVGMFDDNAFFAAQPDGTLLVALPAEMTPARRELSMAHEFVHALHHALSDGVSGVEGSVGALMLSEGIAMHGTRALFPHLPEAWHLGGGDAWTEACHQRIDAILEAVPDHFDARGAQARNRFTLGEGATGMQREAYCAGWHLVARLLDDGWTLASLARLPESRITATLASVLDTGPAPR